MSNTRAREVAGLAAVEAQRPRGHHGRISAHLDYGKGIRMSASGTKLTLMPTMSMSASGDKADIPDRLADVR